MAYGNSHTLQIHISNIFLPVMQDEKNQVLVSNVWIRQVSDFAVVAIAVGILVFLYPMIIFNDYPAKSRGISPDT